MMEGMARFHEPQVCVRSKRGDETTLELSKRLPPGGAAVSEPVLGVIWAMASLPVRSAGEMPCG